MSIVVDPLTKNERPAARPFIWRIWSSLCGLVDQESLFCFRIRLGRITQTANRTMNATAPITTSITCRYLDVYDCQVPVWETGVSSVLHRCYKYVTRGRVIGPIVQCCTLTPFSLYPNVPTDMLRRIPCSMTPFWLSVSENGLPNHPANRRQTLGGSALQPNISFDNSPATSDHHATFGLLPPYAAFFSTPKFWSAPCLSLESLPRRAGERRWGGATFRGMRTCRARVRRGPALPLLRTPSCRW